MMRQAAAAYERRDWTEAERICRLTLSTEPANFDALNLLGIIAVQTRRTEEAVELLSQAVAVNAGNAMAHSNLGAALFNLGRLEKALEIYDRALALQPDYADATLMAGWRCWL